MLGSSTQSLSPSLGAIIFWDSSGKEYTPSWHMDYRDDTPGHMIHDENNTVLLKTLDNRYRLSGEVAMVDDRYGNSLYEFDRKGTKYHCVAYLSGNTFSYIPQWRLPRGTDPNVTWDTTYCYFNSKMYGQVLYYQYATLTVREGQTPDGQYTYPQCGFVYRENRGGTPYLKHVSLGRSIKQYWDGFGKLFDADQFYNWESKYMQVKQNPVKRDYWCQVTVQRPKYQYTMDSVDAKGISTMLFNELSRHIPDMANTALEDVKFFDGNGVALISDLLSVCSAIKGNMSSITNLFDQFAKSTSKAARKRLSKRTREMARELSSLYLSYHYGYRLTRADLLDLRQTIISYCSEAKASSAYAQESFCYDDWNCSATLRILYSPWNPCHSIVTFCDFFDLAPDLDNLWDLVPYSFIVDWFIGIGDAASNISTFFKLERAKVYGSTLSIRAEKKIKDDDYSGQVHAVFYERNVRPHWLPVPRIPISMKTPSDPIHLIEGGTLVCVKR
jgi:hypothetical protein